MKEHALFITGAAGYVGEMLCERLSARSDVSRILALDKEPQPESLKRNAKITWITSNTADTEKWLEQAKAFSPDAVIHTAWQIRELYGRRDLEWRWNIEGTKAIFAFALGTPSVRRLVHFSSASVYGAFPDNTFEHRFTEDEPMREKEYIYGVEKIRSEHDLVEAIEEAQGAGRVTPVVSVIRPAAITGPRGRFARIRFGLQAALAGKLSGNIFYRVISLLVANIPATKLWVRQFVHEDDVYAVVELLALDERVQHRYEVYNLTPPGEPVYAEQMAESTGKRVIRIAPWMARLAFFFFWHLSRGRIPNGPGVWRYYSYPIVMDGSKLTRQYGFSYSCDSRQAFRSTGGYYEHVVPEQDRVHTA